MQIFGNDRYIYGFWFVSHDPALPVEDRMDWWAIFSRLIDDPETWFLDYRFRYHTGGVAQDADDTFHWYNAAVDASARDGEPAKSAEELAQGIHLMAAMISARNNWPCDFTLVEGTADKAAKLFRQKPYAYEKEAPPELIEQAQAHMQPERDEAKRRRQARNRRKHEERRSR